MRSRKQGHKNYFLVEDLSLNSPYEAYSGRAVRY